MAQNARRTDSDFLQRVAAELRAETARKGWSMRDLARVSRVPYPTVQRSLAGHRMIDVAELAMMCGALEVSPAQLLAAIWEPAPSAPEPTARRTSG